VFRSAGRADREPDLMADVRLALAGEHPLGLLGRASSMLAALDPRRRSPFERPVQESVTVEELVQSFIDIELPETSDNTGPRPPQPRLPAAGADMCTATGGQRSSLRRMIQTPVSQAVGSPRQ
jgi:hypothetical protein